MMKISCKFIFSIKTKQKFKKIVFVFAQYFECW